MKVGSTAKRLKASQGSPKPASRSEEPETCAQILTPSAVEVSSGNVNYAAVVAGASHETATAKQGAASTDPRFSGGTSHAANAAGSLDTVSEEVASKQGATNR